jgi:hypothetical protein
VAERTLTEHELNRAMLARQFLLKRAKLPLPRALDRIGGIQAQYAPSSYIGLWTRLAGFRRDDLTRALERRTVAQGTLMRVTIHLVSRADYPAMAAGGQEARRAWWLRATGRKDANAMAAAARKARKFLADGPKRRTELMEHLGLDGTGFNGLGLWIDLVRVPPSGTWERRRADLYATTDDWLGPSDATEGQGVELMVRRYLSGFGPASAKDTANWAGLPMKTVAPVIERMTLRRFRDESGSVLLDLPRAPLPDADTPAPVRILPTWDATLLAHARRTNLLPEEYRPLIFSTKTPHSSPTFLVDGQVAGTAKVEGTRVRVETFAPLPKAARRDLDEEVRRLEAFIA